MKNIEIKDILNADTLSKKDGIYTARWEFFYRFGKTFHDYVDRVKRKFPNAQIIEARENWKPFRGGASTANSSHWYVKFKL